jgi:hypothetical protein|tara:strand:+ start:579 stop:4406 length:3828 start_codon:yes stop_codon:yes gene_type:complete
MPVASGYSIQRNEIIDVDHRKQTETHTGGGSAKTVFFLRSLPDYTDRLWKWDIRVGSIAYNIDRKQGVNSQDGVNTAQTDAAIFEEDQTLIYQEGSTVAGKGTVKYVQNIGTYGSLVFEDTVAPPDGTRIQITYREHKTQWTGLRGGLMYQLARDMVVHPFAQPELFKASTATPLNAADAAVTLSDSIKVRNGTSIKYNDDYIETGQPATQRVASRAWKVVREHKISLNAVDISFGLDGATDISPANPYQICRNDGVNAAAQPPFPLTKRDLGGGEFRVSIDGKVIKQNEFIAKSHATERKTEISLTVPVSTFNWVANTASVNIIVSYHWAPSLDVPYGALVGANGQGPQQGTNFGYQSTGSNISFTWNAANTATGNATIDLLKSTGTATADAYTLNGVGVHNNGAPSSGDLNFLEHNDLMLVQFDDDANFENAFKLIYPTPVSDSATDVLNALDDITDGFLVQSAGGVDLNSDENLVVVDYNPSSNKVAPQRFRVRFEFLGQTSELKVNVATEYQLKDDMTVTKGLSRDGIKYPIYREPGELCDVYEAPAIGRGATYRMSKAKSHWFRRAQKRDDNVSQSYPMSYRLTTTDHGFGLFLFDQASVDQEDDYAWFIVQRHVDQTTGQPEFTGKSPVHCVYSPYKRPIELADLNKFYASSDINDTTKSANIYNTFGEELEAEAPTFYVNPTEALFDGKVNSIDFTGDGYRTIDAANDLDVGFIGGSSATAIQMEDYFTGGDKANNHSIKVPELLITGFDQLPRDAHLATTSAVGNNLAASGSWLSPAQPQLATNTSGNHVFQSLRLPRVSSFVGASANAGYAVGSTSSTSATIAATLADWSDPSYALLDILYHEIADNKDKVMESLVVALDGLQVPMSQNAYILGYDEWVREGDPTTARRFFDMLDFGGVTEFGPKFKLPVASNTGLTGTTASDTITALTISAATNPHLVGTSVDEIQRLVVGELNEVSNVEYGFGANSNAGVYAAPAAYSNTTPAYAPPALGTIITNKDALLVGDVFVQSSNKSALAGKLPGDVIWNSIDNRQEFIYDYFNQTLFFKNPPRASSGMTVKLINYNQGNPSAQVYIPTVPTDRDFPERNLNTEKTINRFIVRESDVFKPWDYHMSATMHEIDSNAIINPHEQLSITQNRDFVFSFPTQLTSQRFYYPRSELDLLAISSADFSTQSGHIEIDKYSDSDAKTTSLYAVGSTSFNPTAAGATYEYAGHLGPDNAKYYWKRNKRKYEGMMSTQPNGNGMRTFIQVTGSSVRYSDVTDGSAPS